MHRAYSLFHVKAIDAAQRRISGIATTPEADRHGDIIEPLGVRFKNPLPLLLFHNSTQPVGTAEFSRPTADGIGFDATIATIEEPGPLRDRVNEAWQSIKAGLITGVSLGFRDLQTAVLKTGGIHFLQSEVLELSLVTVPANASASILTIKAADQARKDRRAMTTAEQITHWSNARAPKAARMADLMATSAQKGATLDEAESKEFDGLEAEVKGIDTHLTRLRTAEQLQIAQAARVEPAAVEKAAGTGHSYTPQIQVKANVPKATAFFRYCQAKAYGRGDTMRELSFAQQWRDSTPEVEMILKAAVAAGTTSDATWAGPLAQLQPIATEFLELLRPATYLGRIPGFLPVPFNTSIPSQTGGGTYQWVGQGAPKPVGKLQFGTITLAITKCAGIIVITEELARVSSPQAEGVIRRDMINGIAQFLDLEFIDPTKAAVTGVSPGSVTNGVTPITSAGTTPANARTDIQALIAAMTAAGVSTSGAALIMSESNAAALGAGLNPLGQPLFPGVTSTGGSVMGITVYASQTASSNVVLVQPKAILYADDGGVTIDVSREASLQMDSAPDNPAIATTVMTSLWQSNYIGLRAERFINWKKARAGCVQYTVQTYVA